MSPPEPNTPRYDAEGRLLPDADWYAAFGSSKFPYRNAGEFVNAWTSNTGSPRYISIVHPAEQREQITSGLSRIAADYSGGERALGRGGTSHHFYGQFLRGAQYSSVRIDQQPLENCTGLVPREVRLHGDWVSTFRIGRSLHGRAFGLHCAFSVFEWPMLIDVAPAATTIKFGRFDVRGETFNTAEFHTTYPVTGFYRTAKLFNAPQSICLQVRPACEWARFLERETAEEIERFLQPRNP